VIAGDDEKASSSASYTFKILVLTKEQMKKRTPQLFFFLAGLLLLTLFFLPLWRISLIAPQYPDGVHMHIHIDKIGGSEPGTLQNVNILNHYIGMKTIDPDAIPELKILPYIIAFFAGLALLFALINNKYLFALWVVLFTITCLLGLYDFYLWEYDYGHNLADNAPMKFDIESFQPPLIGKKDLLNFVAISYPHTGGIAAIVALLLSLVATFMKFRTDAKVIT
jgi:copper chaperone NosL